MNGIINNIFSKGFFLFSFSYKLYDFTETVNVNHFVSVTFVL